MEDSMQFFSKEMIQPSTPTPHYLRHYKLSFLDQLSPSHYFPLIFFYQSDSHCSNLHSAQISQKLKDSLSTALTRFYPLAGTINGSVSVDCDDTGALYIEAQVHTNLSHEMKKSNIENLTRYLPVDPHSPRGDLGRDILLAIQINFFDCGGIAIGVCMSHKIADGSSLVMFMSTWSSICRGDAQLFQPNFELANHHFPPREIPNFGTKTHSCQTKERFVSKRLVFDKEKLAMLKEAISSSSESLVKDPTRVEAVTAFLWKRFMDVAKSRMGKRRFAALHALNLRPRMNPPFPDQAFGNIWRFVVALSTSSDDKEYHDLVAHLRNAVKKTKMENDLNLLDLFSKGETEICTFSSWCRFPVYDDQVDFGWGKPIYVSTAAIPFKNAVILMSTRNSDGVEALVNMLEDDFMTLQKDQDFVSLMVPDMV